MKKVLSLVLAVLMLLSMLPMAVAEEAGALPAMNTTDPIHLVFVDEMDTRVGLSTVMAEKFMEMYPNITIEVIRIDGGYDAGLSNLLAAGQQVDMGLCYYVENLNLANNIMYDLTDFVTNDPDYLALGESLRLGGWYDGKRCFSIPGATVDTVAFYDYTVLDKFNLQYPDHATFTAEEFMEYMTATTDTENGYWSVTGTEWVPATLAPAMIENARGNYGWNGTTVDWTVMNQMYTFAAELKADGHYTWNGQEEYKTFVNDDAWIGLSGRVGCYLHRNNNWPTMLDPNWKTLYGVQYVPYFVPQSSEVENGGQETYALNYFVSATTKYPREAYEALKWMVWGAEGWEYKLENRLHARLCRDGEGGFYLNDELYMDAKARTAADGTQIADYVFGPYGSGAPTEWPAVLTDEVNRGLSKIFPNLGHWGAEEDWYEFFSSRKNPVPSVYQVAPGFNDWVVGVFNTTDYNGYTGNFNWWAVLGMFNAEDYTELFNSTYPEYREATLEKMFAVYGAPAAE